MTIDLTPELFWLSLTVLMTALFWVPYILNRIAANGIRAAMTDAGPDNATHAPWAARAIKAHRNAVENLVIFATVVLTAYVLELSSEAMATAAMVYFFARLAHFVVYTAGIPVARTLAFAAGWGAQMVFLASILGWM